MSSHIHPNKCNTAQKVSGSRKQPKPPTNFSDLPTELRLQIWKLAISDPQILHVQARCSWTKANERSLLFCCGSPRGLYEQYPDAMLKICKESREIALTRLHTTTFHDPENPSSLTRFDPELDTIYITNFVDGPPWIKESLFGARRRNNVVLRLDKIQKLALPLNSIFHRAHGAPCVFEYDRLSQICSMFPDLELLTLVHSHGSDYSYRDDCETRLLVDWMSLFTLGRNCPAVFHAYFEGVAFSLRYLATTLDQSFKERYGEKRNGVKLFLSVWSHYPEH